MADKSEEPKTEKASILATSSSRKTKDPATTTTATKAKVESQRVSFRQEINDAEGFVVTGKKATRSARVGKADPVRDAGIFLAIIAIFYVVAQSLSGVGQPPPDGEMVEELKSGGSNRSGSKIKRMREAMAKLLEAKVKDTINPPRDLEKDPCLVWLTSSSVPHSGWGLYAGQNYTAGQEIMLLEPPSLTIYTGDSSSSQLTVVPEAFLLKHHPTKSNVVPSSPFWTEIASESQAAPSISLKATRLISEGEELFVDYTHHLHSILPEWYHEVLPVLDDYEEATFLLHRSRQSIRDPPGPRGRQMSKQQSVVGQAMMLVTKVVERYRPAAAKLLVQALHGMSQYRGRADDANCLDLGLKSPTWKSLTQYGMCSTDIGHQLDGTTKLTRSKRPFLKGQKVHPIPVLLRQSKHGDCAKEDSSETCTVSSTASDFCWALPTTSLEACPLSSIDYLSSLLQVHKEANTPNVEIRWMKWEKVKTLAAYLQNEDEMTGPNDMLENLWGMELVATRDLEAGEQLVLGNISLDSTTGQWILPEALVSTPVALER